MDQWHTDLPEGQEAPLPAPQLDPKAALSGEDLGHAYKRMDAEKLARIQEHVRQRLRDLPLLVECECAAATQKGNGMPRHENGFVASHGSTREALQCSGPPARQAPC
jgi:hypothetical protein